MKLVNTIFFIAATFFGLATMPALGQAQPPIPVAQPAHVVRYSTDHSGKKVKELELKNATVGIALTGTLGAETKRVLMENRKVENFAEGGSPCYLPGQPVVCISSADGRPIAVSGSSYVSSYGSGSNSSVRDAQSGNEHYVAVFVSLIQADGSSVALCQATSKGFSGSTSAGNTGNYTQIGGGRRGRVQSFGGNANFNRVISPEEAKARARRDAMLKMFGAKIRALDGNTHIDCFPGANEVVADAFGGSAPKKLAVRD
jgi:hypothetical protein